MPALLIAIGQDQDMAEHMGVNLLRYKVYTLLLTACMTLILVIRLEGIVGKREFRLNRLKAAIFKKTYQKLV